MEAIIDGCCDTIYVATGTLAVCGVPDLPHLDEVCRANNAKFPGGQGVCNTYGKYTKPEGWVPPNHFDTADKYHGLSLQDVARALRMRVAP